MLLGEAALGPEGGWGRRWRCSWVGLLWGPDGAGSRSGGRCSWVGLPWGPDGGPGEGVEGGAPGDTADSSMSSFAKVQQTNVRPVTNYFCHLSYHGVNSWLSDNISIV